MNQFRIYSLIFISPLGQFVVTLEELNGTRLIPIWIGMNEGNSIAMALNGEKFHRPLTHDLVISILNATGAVIEKVVINDLKENSYYSVIAIKQTGNVLEVDSRPSDSLALAARVNCPIFVEEKVLKACPVINKPITEEEVVNFEKEIESIRPEDFFKRLDEEGGKAEGGL
ncbi:MAG: bifunctional nuclease family protein [Candidatus Omnitrophota bacterium]